MMSKEMAEILAEARNKASLSQRDLAQKMGYSNPQFVSNWERGLCGLPPKKAALFCHLTGFSPDQMRKLLIAEEARKIETRFRVHTSKKKVGAK